MTRKVLLVKEHAKSKSALMVKALTQASGQFRSQFASVVRSTFHASHCCEVITL